MKQLLLHHSARAPILCPALALELRSAAAPKACISMTVAFPLAQWLIVIFPGIGSVAVRRGLLLQLMPGLPAAAQVSNGRAVWPGQPLRV